jgi:hypothetical protein
MARYHLVLPSLLPAEFPPLVWDISPGIVVPHHAPPSRTTESLPVRHLLQHHITSRSLGLHGAISPAYPIALIQNSPPPSPVLDISPGIVPHEAPPHRTAEPMSARYLYSATARPYHVLPLSSSYYAPRNRPDSHGKPPFDLHQLHQFLL